MRKNMLTAFLLKSYDPSLPNRGENGEAKQILMDVPRARISSQCLTRAIKEHMGEDLQTIRSAHLEDLVEGVLKKMAADGTISEDQIDYYGQILCAPKKKDKKEKDKDSKKENGKKLPQIFDCSWDERASVGGDRSEDASENKGRTVTVTNPYEVYAIIKAVVSAPEGTKPEAYADIAKKACEEVRIGFDKAMFGTMATAGTLESVPSAIYKGETYSIDIFRPENDFITAAFMEQGNKSSDPFFGEISDFANTEKNVPRADAITSSWLYANTMYSKTGIDMDILKDNLTRNSVGGSIDIPEDTVVAEMKQLTSAYVEAFSMAVPSGSSKRHVTCANPGILYMESVKGGNPVFEDFSKVIKADDAGTGMEHGIEQLMAFAKNDAWRRGEINRYVYLDAKYAERFEKDFVEAGVTVIHTLGELESVLSAEVERLV